MRVPDLGHYLHTKSGRAEELRHELAEHAQEVYGDNRPNQDESPENLGSIQQLSTSHPQQRRLELTPGIIDRGKSSINSFLITNNVHTRDRDKTNIALIQRYLRAQNASTYLHSVWVNSLGRVSIDLRPGVGELPWDFYWDLAQGMMDRYKSLGGVVLKIGSEYPEHKLDGVIISRSDPEQPAGPVPAT